MRLISLLVNIHHSAFRGFIIASGQLLIAFEQAERHLFVMVNEGVFADPV
jgi:hypothetical protein